MTAEVGHEGSARPSLAGRGCRRRGRSPWNHQSVARQQACALALGQWAGEDVQNVVGVMGDGVGGAHVGFFERIDILMN